VDDDDDGGKKYKSLHLKQQQQQQHPFSAHFSSSSFSITILLHVEARERARK
jgi:hypothetical protein